MWTIKRTILETIIILWCLFLSAGVCAEDYKFTPDEARLLPPICHGNAFNLHFCHGLKSVMRADRSIGNKHQEYENLSAALSEFHYVLGHDQKNNRFYRTMASIEMGKIYHRLDQTADAMKMYYQAIKYNPKIPQAYAGLSDIYLDLGQVEEARKVLETGLKQAPKSKSLKRRFENLSKK